MHYDSVDLPNIHSLVWKHGVHTKILSLETRGPRCHHPHFVSAHTRMTEGGHAVVVTARVASEK